MNYPVENYYFRTETNQRANNEDNVDRFELDIASELPLTVLSLADGMGGYAHGEEISWAGLRQFQQQLRGKLQSVETAAPLTIDRLKQALIVALQQTHANIRQQMAANNWDKAGATIVAAAIWQNRMVVTNLGDSPLFHYRAATGDLTKVTLDHSVTGILAQAGIITEEMARHHERRGQLEYFLGARSSPEPLPVYERELGVGDVVMLCSDGINGLLSLEQMRQILAIADTSLVQKADALIGAARAAGETDNQTLILWCHPARAERHSVTIADANGKGEHKQPERTQDLITVDATSPRGRAIDRASTAPLPELPTALADPPKTRSLAARTLLWATYISVITIAAATAIGWDTGWIPTVDLRKFLPGKVEKSPAGAPPELPKQLPPEREPIDLLPAVTAPLSGKRDRQLNYPTPIDTRLNINIRRKW